MNNIRKLRKQKGYTCESLGKIVGVSKSAIAKYERGDIQPSQDILLKLAKILDTSIDYLFGLTNNPIPLHKAIPTCKPGSAEWLRQGLIARGAINENDSVTDAQLKIMLTNLDVVAQLLNNKT